MAITLNPNAIFNSLSNQIISQRVFADNIQEMSEGILELNRVDGSMYGDTKLYYDTDILEVNDWLNDAEATNLLALDRPKAPIEQKIVLNVFKQIRLTLDYYLTKQAWINEGSFSEFTTVMMSWLNETKRAYDITIHNAFVGTKISTAKNGTININLKSAASGDPLFELKGQEYSRTRAQIIAQDIAQTIKNMASTIHARKFTENGNYKTFAKSNLKILWNNKFVTELEKRDLPTIFHKEGLFEDFDKYSMDEQFFGVEITSQNLSTYSASTPTTKKPINSSTGAYTPGNNNSNGKVCAKQPMYFTSSGTFRTNGTRGASTDIYVMAGEELPSGAIINSTNLALSNFGVYIVTDDIICKITVENSVPMMSGFQVGTEFYNPRSLTTNHYLTYGHNELTLLKSKPLITIKAVTD